MEPTLDGLAAILSAYTSLGITESLVRDIQNSVKFLKCHFSQLNRPSGSH